MFRKRGGHVMNELGADERGTALFSRRRVLAGIGCVLIAGGATTTLETDAFTRIGASRKTRVSAAADSDAFIGLSVSDTVQFNQQERLVEITNRTDEIISFSVSLDTCAHGTLHVGGNSYDCEIQPGFDVSPGGSELVEITADVKENTTIPFEVSGTSTSLAFEATRETEAVTGNTGGPTADAGGPYRVYEDSSVELDGTGSEGTIQGYSWQITDGPGSLTEASTETPVYHAPSDVQNDTDVTVELEVTDNNGQTDTDTTTVTVEDAGSGNQAPIARFTSNRNGKNVTLDASSSSDPDGSIDRYEWDVQADGSIEYTGQTVKNEKINSGTDVKLIVTDSEGTTDSVTKSIE